MAAEIAEDRARGQQDRRAAVIGCGVGGLTTARQLQRRGFDVTIYAWPSRPTPPPTCRSPASHPPRGSWKPISAQGRGTLSSGVPWRLPTSSSNSRRSQIRYLMAKRLLDAGRPPGERGGTAGTRSRAGAGWSESCEPPEPLPPEPSDGRRGSRPRGPSFPDAVRELPALDPHRALDLLGQLVEDVLLFGATSSSESSTRPKT